MDEYLKNRGKCINGNRLITESCHISLVAYTYSFKIEDLELLVVTRYDNLMHRYLHLEIDSRLCCTPTLSLLFENISRQTNEERLC